MSEPFQILSVIWKKKQTINGNPQENKLQTFQWNSHVENINGLDKTFEVMFNSRISEFYYFRKVE